MLVVVVAVGVLMSLAFGAGVAADGGTTAGGLGNAYRDGYFPGCRLFACLIAILVVIAIMGLIGCAFRGPRYFGAGPSDYSGPGYGWHGRHRRHWHDEYMPESDAAMEEWHRRVHGDGPGAPTTATPPAPESPKPPRGKVK